MAKRKRHFVSNSENEKSMKSSTDPPRERNLLNDSLLSLYQKQAMDLKGNHLSDSTNAEDANKLSEEPKEPPKTPAKRKQMRNPVLTPVISTTTLYDVGGMDDIIEEIFEIFLHYKIPTLYSNFKESPTRGILLHGPPGCGKTHLARAIAGSLEVPLLEVAATAMVCGISGESESKIRETFDAALTVNSRCILFIDEIDAICSKRHATDSAMMGRMVSQMIKCMDDLAQKDRLGNVLVIAATNFPDSIDPSLRRGMRFERELAIGIPNEEARLKILEILCERLKLPESCVKWIAHHTPGYVGADLRTLVKYGIQKGFSRIYKDLVRAHTLSKKEISTDGTTTDGDKDVTKRLTIAEQLDWFKTAEVPQSVVDNLQLDQEDFKFALQSYVPTSKREGFASVPTTTWSDVGALEDVKEELRQTILWPVKHTEFFEAKKISTTKGILLYGPKGCGKTLLAKALANECSINFLSVNGPELLSMYVGESEKAVRRVFERARNSAPCVIFFDEFDALCPPRSSSKENPVAERVVNQLLTETDGMQDRKRVFLIAATNRLDKIDSAMIRPGRLEKVIYVGLPTPENRVDILRSLTKNKTLPKCTDDLQLEDIALDSRCRNYSGADLAYLVREATMGAVKEAMAADDLDGMVLHMRHFDSALDTVKPSFSEQDKKHLLNSSHHLGTS